MKKCAAIAAFLACLGTAGAEGFKFNWTLGDVGGGYNFTANKSLFVANLARFSWLHEGTGLGISTTLTHHIDQMAYDYTDENGMDIYTSEVSYTSLCPVEVFYFPFRWKQAALALFARGGLEFSGERGSETLFNGLFAGAGLRAGFLSFGWGSYQSYLFNAFAEWTTHNEIRAGITCDAAAVVALVVLAALHPDDRHNSGRRKERRKEKPRSRPDRRADVSCETSAAGEALWR
jgi:hypothetical protein